MNRPDSPVALRLYRRIARLAPRDVRDRFSDDQVELFEQLWRNECPSSGWSRRWWTLRHLTLALMAGMKLRVDRIRRGRDRSDLITGGHSGGGWRAPLVMDARYAARSLRQSPWFTLTSIAVLGSAVALATAAFAIVDGVLFKPLPYVRTPELYLVRVIDTAKPTIEPPPVAGMDVAAWSDAAPELAMTAVGRPFSYKTLEGRQYSQISVDERFFETLGVRPFVGNFSPEDFDAVFDPQNTPGFWQPIVISYWVWQREFGGDPAILGQAVTTSTRGGRSFGFRVRGVMPPEFAPPVDVGAVAPEVLTPMSSRRIREAFQKEHFVIARIPPGVSALAVRDRFLTATKRRVAAGPVSDHAGGHGWRPEFNDLSLIPLSEHLGRRQRSAFGMVFAGTAVLLCLACLTIGGLAAARSTDRRREYAVRRALGAGLFAIARGVFVEVLLLAVLSTGLALVLAKPLLFRTLTLLPSSIALLKTPAIDARVLAAAAAFTMIAAVLVVCWPISIAWRAGLAAGLNRGGHSGSSPVRRSNRLVVAAQVAMGFILLTGGGLTVTSLAAAWRSDAGYDRERVILLPSFVKEFGHADDSDKLRGFMDVVRRTPGVDAVSASTLPMFAADRVPWTGVMPEGWKEAPQKTDEIHVDASYFDTLGLRLIDGRWPAAGEWAERARLAIVTETAARNMWPGQSAVGQTLVRVRPRDNDPTPMWTVIGVVNDARYRALDEDPIGDIFLPEAIGRGTYGSFLVVRTSDPAEEVMPALLAAAAANGMRVEKPATIRDALFASVRHRVLPAWLFGSLGVVAIIILGAGIFGLLAMAAAQRTREMGIRIALGATSDRILGLMVREQLTAVLGGLITGAFVSLWTVRGLEAQLYGVRPYDPAVWMGVAGIVIIIAAVATIVPALRATTADPVVILRAE